MKSLSTINRIHRILERNVTQIDPNLSYERVIRALELLGMACEDYPGETGDWLYIGGDTYPIDSFIVGGYWHFTQWHEGQWSDSYRALCSLGSVFSPGMSDGPEEGSSEKDIYDCLDVLAEGK